ncbi:hypothetical protein GDO81_015759 [Engystomops pustulosus]|uniref:Uncharacterized protein n=1 Tax=Engystomops pustulosus TaxID=76066 RepID=A0AAV7AMW6_ENGPU|nr:hypothetical protein GDO81_015759 [Engystomops pustulosus]
MLKCFYSGNRHIYTNQGEGYYLLAYSRPWSLWDYKLAHHCLEPIGDINLKPCLSGLEWGAYLHPIISHTNFLGISSALLVM